jgi:intracellular multiplication protein IcmM
MTKQVWNTIKRSKRFYVRYYRKLGSILILSATFNIVLGLAITYKYLNLPERDYYSTYGETPPVLLAAMDEPNYSSTPLLIDIDRHDSEVKVMLK